MAEKKKTTAKVAGAKVKPAPAVERPVLGKKSVESAKNSSKPMATPKAAKPAKSVAKAPAPAVNSKPHATKKPAESKTVLKPAKPASPVKSAPAKSVASTKPVEKPAAAKPAAAKPMTAKSTTAKPVAAPVEATRPAEPITPAVAKPAAKPVVAQHAPMPKPAPAATGHAAPVRTMAQAVGKPMAMKGGAPLSPKDIAQRAAAAAAAATSAAAKKPVSSRHGFKTNEYVVYPAHGVGRIVGIEEQEIAGMSLELFVITFDKDKLTLRVPTGKLQSVGMRKLAEEPVVKKAMETLKGRARIKRTMWSRRAQEYEAKINSGDLVSIAEVVRDLFRSEAQPEQSYSERQLYEAALDRMAREIAAVERLDERGAVQRITEVLARSAKGRRLAAEGAEAVEAEGAEIKAA